MLAQSLFTAGRILHGIKHFKFRMISMKENEIVVVPKKFEVQVTFKI
jgi:hypothetical protein